MTTASPDLDLDALDVYRPERREFDPRPEFLVRPGTSDVKAVDEVFVKNAYRRPRKGFVIEPGDVWLDAGANVGAFSVLVGRCAARLGGAVEAEATNVQLARLNVLRNGLDPQRVRHAALVDDAWEDPFAVLHVNTAPLALRRHSVTKARRDSTPVEVPAIPISRAVALAGANAVKLNIEGAEVPILLAWTPPAHVRKLVAEWSFDVEPRLAVLEEVLERLRARYANVELSKRVDWTETEWRHYPPNVYVYAWDPPRAA